MNDDRKNLFSIVLSFLAIFFSVIAIYTSQPYNWKLNFVGLAIAILTILVTILIGWNIYSVLDLKGYKRKYNQLLLKIERETNYLHNKADYHYGLSMCYNSISLASSISKGSDENVKYQMYIQGAQGMKILSNMCEFEHCNSVIDILYSTENATSKIKLTSEERKQIVEVLKEIPNMNKINGLFELIEILNK